MPKRLLKYLAISPITFNFKLSLNSVREHMCAYIYACVRLCLLKTLSAKQYFHVDRREAYHGKNSLMLY